MVKSWVIVTLILWLLIWWAGSGAAPATDSGQHEHRSHAEEPTGHGNDSCGLGIHIMDEAERQPGGARHAAAMQKPHHGEHSGHAETSTSSEGMHMIHEPQFGGAFYMAPDQLHHLELLYSNECGIRIVFYNALTQPIDARRFRAFVRILPKDQDLPETLRFLSPSVDGTFLRTSVGAHVDTPFKVELYVEFPESDEPELFNATITGSDH